MKDTLLGMFAIASTTLFLASGCGGALDGPADGTSSKRANGFNLSVDCTSNSDCPSGEYCKKQACGAETGTCEAEPQGCTDHYDPVCGCDGQTHSNTCYAASQGVNVAKQGECSTQQPPKKQPPTPKGCTSDADCGSSEYCRKQACGDATGTCDPQPQACTEQCSPVCGCGGQTYGNACKAASQGASVAHTGTCDSKPTPKGCTSDADCSSGEYCKNRACGARTGTCTVEPRACTDHYEPVCGCDGQTYSNACYAAARGVTVAKQGECR